MIDRKNIPYKYISYIASKFDLEVVFKGSWGDVELNARKSKFQNKKILDKKFFLMYD
ncbi:MAG: hypothetical protein WBJ13_14530 [Sedimentibacter sp.]